jgi:hypothetical protein
MAELDTDSTPIKVKPYDPRDAFLESLLRLEATYHRLRNMFPMGIRELTTHGMRNSSALKLKSMS